MHRRQNRNALRLLSLAACAGLGLYHNTDPANPEGGAGGGAAPPTKKPDDKKPEAKEPSKVTMTAEEFAKKLDDAKAAAKAEADAERAKEREKAEADEAKKKGEFEKLYQGETARVKELEGKEQALKLDLRRKDVAIELHRHLAAEHKDYVENDVDILPHIQFDAETPDEDLKKRIKDATSAYVKRNPRASVLPGVPGGAARGKMEVSADVPRTNPDDKRAARPMGPAARF